ncbi:hypothetical protein C7475_102510 [Chitinophaga sp. S165]|nr:hypothetical protein C7475_102510 [Chitinophaga sp. S165]
MGQAPRVIALEYPIERQYRNFITTQRKTHE